MQHDLFQQRRKVKFIIYILIIGIAFSLIFTGVFMISASGEHEKEKNDSNNADDYKHYKQLMDSSLQVDNFNDGWNDFDITEDLYINKDTSQDSEKIIVNIPQGTSGITVGKILEEKGLLQKGDFKRLLIKFNFGSRIKAGSYEFNSDDTIVDILDKILIN